MGIDISNTSAKQCMQVDELQHLAIVGDHGLRQFRKGADYQIALTDGTEGQLAGHKRMHEHLAATEQARKKTIAAAQMIDPDRRVDQNHAGSSRRLGGALNSGSLPPRRASRRALSRSISAFNASRTSADFSCKPVRVRASATNSSSRA